MPKSKRNKIVNLNKVKPKNRDHKEKEIKKLNIYLKTYKHIFVFKYNNLNNEGLEQLRNEFEDTKFCFTKLSLIKIALGTEEKSNYPNSYLIANIMKGDMGLVFTNMDKNTFINKINDFYIDSFLTPESIAPCDILMLFYK